MNTRIHLSFVIFLLSFFFILFSCQKDPTALDNAEIELKAEYVEVTEAWLKLMVSPPDSRSTYIVKRDTHTVFYGKLYKADTIIHDQNLEPNKEYAYRAWREINGEKSGNHAKLNITTMDTTSHDFAWQFYKFGWPKRGSVLHDVAIVKEDNSVWCVGEIHTENTDCWNEDSTEWIKGYNALRWDSKKWNMVRTYPSGNSFNTNLSVYCFLSNDIWVGTSAPYHWDGSNWKPYDVNGIHNGYIKKIWGLHNSLYIVGTNGSISNFNGIVWSKIESGTDVRLVDIYGSQSGNRIWICGWGGVDPTVLLKIENNQVSKLIESKEILGPYNPNGISGAIKSVWVDSQENLYILTWFDLYKCPKGDINKAKSLWRVKHNQSWAFNRVRGNDLNDMVTVGTYGNIWHYNGKTWKHFEEIADPRDEFLSVDIYEDMIVAVGERYINGIERYGIVYVGKR